MAVRRIAPVDRWIAKIASDCRGIGTVLARAAICRRTEASRPENPERSGLSVVLPDLNTHAHLPKNPRIYSQL